MSQRSNVYGNAPSGLVNAVLETGRQRGDAATPRPATATPSPTRHPQQQIPRMNSGNVGRPDFARSSNNSQSSFRPGGQLSKKPSFGHQLNMSQSSLRSPEAENRRPGYTNYPNASQSSIHSNSPHKQGVLVRHDRNDSAGTQRSGQSSQSFSSGDAGVALALRPPNNSQYSHGTGQGLMNSRREYHNLSLVDLIQVELSDFEDFVRTLHLDRNSRDAVLARAQSMKQSFRQKSQDVQSELENSSKITTSREQELRKFRDEYKTMEQDFLQKLQECEQDREELQHEFDRFRDVARIRDKKQLDDLDRFSGWYENKRALWMETNPEPSARQEQLLAIRVPTSADYPPFDSLSTERASRPGSSRMSRLTSPSSSSSFSTYGQASQMGPPTGPASQTPSRRGQFTHDIPTQRSHTFSTRSITSSQDIMPPPRAEAGDITPYHDALGQSPEASVVEYRQDIDRLFQMIEGWTRSYTCVPNYEGDKSIAATEQHNWQYMTTCVNPYRQQEAYTHIMALLSDPETRYLFVKRMLVQHCTKEILNIKAWENYSREVKQVFDAVRQGLSERGLANEARQRLVDRQVSAIKHIIDADNYKMFHRLAIDAHCKSLRSLTNSLVDEGVARDQCGKDLGAIVMNAWRLSVKMNTSRFSFQTYYPDTAGKFVAATMTAINDPNNDPMSLQVRQARMKLVITPGITRRDDTGTTIIANHLHSATVLIMW